MNLMILLFIGVFLCIILFVHGGKKYFALTIYASALIYIILVSGLGVGTVIKIPDNYTGGQARLLKLLTPENIKLGMVYEELERDTGIKVIQTTYRDSNDFQEIIQSDTSFDVIIAEDYLNTWLYDIGKSERVDYKKIPNVKLLHPSITQDERFSKLDRASAPYLYSLLGVGYNRSYFDDIPVDWEEVKEVLSAVEMKGRVLLTSDMRSMLGLMLSTSGFSINSTIQDEVGIASNFLIRLMDLTLPYIKGGDPADLFIDESALIGIITSSDLNRAMHYNPQLRFVHADVGSIMQFTNFSIMKGREGGDTAYEYINYMYIPKIAAEVTNTTYQANLIDSSSSFVNSEILNGPSYFFPEFKKEFLRKSLTNVENSILENAWSDIMIHYDEIIIPQRKELHTF